MTRRFKFTGPAAVDVPALGLTVEPGQTVTVEDPDVSAGLDGQSQWEPVKAAKKRAAKKAPAKKAAPAADSNDEKKG